MNTQWQQFLTNQGAKFDNKNNIETFGLPDIEHFMVKHGPIITDLSKQALIQVTGEDSFSFLQGQFSNDLKDVSNEKAQLTSYCSPQGKVLAIITIFKIDNSYLLSFDESLKETILKRLTMFKMMAKVELKEVSEELIQIGYAGEFADLDMQRDLSIKIKELHQSAKLNLEEIKDITIIKIPGPYHKYILFGEINQIQKVWQILKANGEAIGTINWTLLDIIAGQPTINQNTSDKFIAQFINLDKLDAINFKKGCYPGQEVIARMHYRGKATKRMLRIHTSIKLQLQANDEIKLQDENQRNYKFIVISSAPEIYEGTIFLAISTVKALESVTGDLKDQDGNIYSIEPMPYALNEE